MLEYLILYFIIAIALRNKHIKLAIFSEIILLIVVLQSCDISGVQVDPSLFCMRVVIGYLLSLIVLYITYISVFWIKPKVKRNMCITMESVLSVVIEEIVWRFCFLSILESMKSSFICSILLATLENFLFIFSHFQVNRTNIKDGIEMFLYSCILLIFGKLFWGINIGLHLGRNVLCKEEEKNERTSF